MLMAKTRFSRRDLNSYTIRGSEVVKAGDCVLMRPSKRSSAPYVARVEKIEADSSNIVRFRVRWFYRPEDIRGGRRQFHGLKEVFLSDHYDIQSAQTVEGKCTVHSLMNYMKLENIGPEDYFCRFEYKPASESFLPDRVVVYCKCELPYNPDKPMTQCVECEEWYHPACLGMTIDQVKELRRFVCPNHASNSSLANGMTQVECQKK